MINLVGHSLGKYHILEQLGEGGMAVVYKAYDTKLERTVAIKVILPHKQQSEKFLKRFEREARALARLSHPNIIKILDYGEHEGIPFLVMEFVEGETLKRRLEQPVSWTEAVRIVSTLARALETVHQQNIIHRDIKPSNILMDRTGNVFLSDFGVARLIDNEETADLTGTGVGVGTPEYMSPEQVMGKQVDSRSDIYSLGIVLYQLVTGRTPFKADTPMAVGFKQVSEPLPRPTMFAENITQDIEYILVKALAKEPANRYQTMNEFADTLEKQSSVNKLAGKRGASRKKITALSLRPVWIGLGFLAVAVAGVLVGRSIDTTPQTATSTSIPIQTEDIVYTKSFPPIIPTSSNITTPTITPASAKTPSNDKIVSACPGFRTLCIHNGSGQLIDTITIPGLAGIISNPTWSPDGNRILFAVIEGIDIQKNNLYYYDTATKQLTQLTNDQINNLAATWSPGGSLIASHSGCSLRLINPQSLDSDFLVQEVAYCVDVPRFSPNSSWLAWVSPNQKDGNTDLQFIQILDIETKEIIQTKVQFDNVQYFNLAWSPDGDSLYFLGNGKTYQISLGCLKTSCSNLVVEQVGIKVPEEWFPNYYPQWGTDKPPINSFGTALRINDETGYGLIPYNSNLDLRKALTIEAWVNLGDIANACVWRTDCGFSAIIGQGYSASSAGNFTFGVGEDGVLFAFMGADSRLIGYSAIPKNEWVHIAVTHTFGNGQTSVIYVNGVPVGRQEWKNDAGQSISGNDYPWANAGADYYIGQYGVAKPNVQFIGSMDELRIWNVVRTQDELIDAMKHELTGTEPGLVAYWNFNVEPGVTFIPDLSVNNHEIELHGNSRVESMSDLNLVLP